MTCTCGKVALTRGQAKEQASNWNRNELHRGTNPRLIQAYRCPDEPKLWHLGNSRPRSTPTRKHARKRPR